MKKRDHYLTGFLLLLTGILIGTILAMYQDESQPVHSRVEVTEVKKDAGPLIPDSTLGKMDARFLMKEVVNQVRPSVVYIESEVPIRDRQLSDRRGEGSDDNLLDKLFPDRKVKTVGSGVVISSDGYILTNNHVIEGAEERGIEVTLYDKRSYEATVVGRDPSTDLAVLKVPAAGLPAITIGNSDNIEVGEWVMAIGNPFRLKSTVTAGIVSALHRNVQIIDMENDLRVESFIQTDAAINKGNSGGALVNTEGQLIGINTAIASESGSYQGYGFAVPVNLAIKVGQDLIEFGEVKRAFLGIEMEAIDFERSKQLGMDKVYGVEILRILDESSAASAGLRVNDAIVEIGGEPIQEANELQQKIAEHRPGDIIRLTLFRDGEQMEKKVQLKSVEQTAEYLTKNREEPRERQWESDRTREQFQSYELGITVMALAKPEDSRQNELVITDVFLGSEAWKAGLRKGGVIERVDGEKVMRLADFKKRLRHSLDQNDEVSLFVELNNHKAKSYTLQR